MAEFRNEMPQLMPPPGGLQRLRVSLSKSRSHNTIGFAEWGALASLTSVIFLLCWIQLDRSPQAELAALLPLSPAPIVVDEGAAKALPSANQDVQIYLVMQGKDAMMASTVK